MSLVLAVKNRNSIVVASDTDAITDEPGFGEMMTMPNRCVLLIAGNLESIRQAIQTAIAKLHTSDSAAVLAQLVSAALVLEVVPKLADTKGRTELIVAGFDHLHRQDEPALYYLDSAQDFHLTLVTGDAVAGGATAAVSSLVAGHSYADSNSDYLKILAKECIASTKLRWPTAIRGRIKLGVITTTGILIQNL